MTELTEERARETFDRCWRSLHGMFYRLDKGVSGGRNASATEGAMRMQFERMHEAYLALDGDDDKRDSRYGYAERRLKLGRADAESYKQWRKSLGKW